MAEVSEDWHRCYGQGWGDLLAPEAYSHPAKVSRALARRIYDHLIDEGWLEPGMAVIDPFAGICGFALHAMKHGLNWVGVELEEKFVDLGQQNIDLWNSRFSQLPGWGSAVILRGDSRRLVEVVQEINCCISSPPYCDQKTTPGNVGHVMMTEKWGTGTDLAAGHEVGYSTDPANLGNMPEGKLADAVVSSPPYAGNRFDGGEESLKRKQGFSPGYSKSGGYGDNSPGQLANMPEGEFANAVVSSPPYAGGCSHTGGDDPRPEHIEGGELRYVDYGINEGQLANMPEGEFDGVVASPPYAGIGATTTCDTSEPAEPEEHWTGDKRKGRQGTKWQFTRQVTRDYGNTDGQLAALPEGEFEACVSSPPWEHPHTEFERPCTDDFEKGWQELHGKRKKGGPFWYRGKKYEDDTNLGNIQADTFWSAARQIVQQVYQLLAPGAPAVWVVKAFVRKGKRVDFPGQWRQMCESVGFETVHIHRAWLVEDRGGQFDLFGKVQENKVERKSFFRRLHEYKASAKMYWEQHVTDRSIKAKYLRNSHQQVWESYHYELANPKKDLPLPTLPTRSKITANARVMAYKDADEPWMDIDTRIDFEVVLCQRKPA